MTGRRLALWASIAMLIAGNPTAQSQTPVKASAPELIIMGKVSRVDPVKKTLHIQTKDESANRQLGGIGQAEQKRRETFPTRASDRFPPQGLPAEDLDLITGDRPGNIEAPPAAQLLTTQVYVSSGTTFKSGGKAILFADLKVSDYVVVKGKPKGRDIEASEVVRREQK